MPVPKNEKKKDIAAAVIMARDCVRDCLVRVTQQLNMYLVVANVSCSKVV